MKHHSNIIEKSSKASENPQILGGRFKSAVVLSHPFRKKY